MYTEEVEGQGGNAWSCFGNGGAQLQSTSLPQSQSHWTLHRTDGINSAEMSSTRIDRHVHIFCSSLLDAPRSMRQDVRCKLRGRRCSI